MIQKLLCGAFGYAKNNFLRLLPILISLKSMAEVLWEDLSPATQKLPLLNVPNSPNVSLIHNILLRDKFVINALSNTDQPWDVKDVHVLLPSFKYAYEHGCKDQKNFRLRN